MSLTQDALRRIIDYDPDTGIFTWRIQARPQTSVGSRAGYPKEHGYRVIGIGQREYYEHRLAWLYTVGTWPRAQIDHINMDRADNRWVNLREATQGENHRNKRAYKNNTSGFKGVFFHKPTAKYLGIVTRDGVSYSTRYFAEPEQANAAVCALRQRVHGEFTRHV
jgi:hypothetical protein